MVSCKTCSKTFSTVAKLKRHSAVHVVSCKACSQTFSSESKLKRHFTIHDFSISYPCKQCKFVSSRKDSLKRHYDLYHDDSHAEIESNTVVADSGNIVQKPDELAVGNAISVPDNHFNSNSFDHRLQLPNNFIYAGATQSGKTTLLMKTLENASKIYNPVLSRIFFLYSCYQDNYTTLKEKLAAQGIECVFHKASTITEHELEEIADPNGGQTLIIIDDDSIAAASSKEVAQVFTIARHKNCSMVLLLHFIFGHWPSSRIISANTSYFFLLKSPRMLKQISTLGAQLQKQNALLSAYERETRKSYGYVLLDLCTATPEHMRLRTNIFGQNEGYTNPDKRIVEPVKRKLTLDKSTQTEPTVDDDDDEPPGNPNFVYIPWEESRRQIDVDAVFKKRKMK